MSSYKIQIYQAQQLVQTLTLNELVIVGRRDSRVNDPLPIKLSRTNDSLRLVVADQHVDSIPGTWLSVVRTVFLKFKIDTATGLFHAFTKCQRRLDSVEHSSEKY